MLIYDEHIDKLRRASESTLPVGKEIMASFQTDDAKMKLKFRTDEGLIVKVYKASITNLKVDAIVNAANETLSNSDGVALVIAAAAGSETEKECQEKVSNYGTVSDGDNRVTTAGSLGYKGIIHAVGPRWSAYENNEQCLKILVETVVNIMETARGCRFKSIAMPPISSGIFGVPKRLCAAMYINGILKFSSKNNLGSLKEFHIVDIKDEVLDMITDCHRVDPTCLTIAYLLTNMYDNGGPGFDRRNETKHQTFDGNDGFAYCGQLEPFSFGSILVNKDTGKPGKLMESVFKIVYCKTEIHIYTENILRLKNIDAVVVSESKAFLGERGLAKLLLQKGGEMYKNVHDKHKKGKYYYGKVIITSGAKLPFRHVFHAVLEKMPYYGHELYLTKLQRTIKEILSTADGMKGKISLAMPLIGSGGISDPATLRSYCYAVSEAIWNYLRFNRQTKMQQIHLVNIDDNITKILREIFHRYNKRGAPPSRHNVAARAANEQYAALTHDFKLVDSWKVDQNLENKSSDISKYFDTVESAYSSAKGNLQIFGDNDDENCVICLCEMKCPVRLKNCSHKFCRECITEFFMTKSSCPVCGTVYGKIYGDQPRDGTAKVFLDPTSLPGYEGKKSYMIVYDFPPGKQESYHPDPGKAYDGFKRRAFLPDCPEGIQVLLLLKRAFEQGITFTIGTSRTTRKEGVITWNDIHHKTSKTGGPQKFGYPDPEYLERVTEELYCKGIVGDN